MKSAERDDLGRLVRDIWLEWAHQQPDAGTHPHWLLSFDDLEPRHQELDRVIGEGIWRVAIASFAASVRSLADFLESGDTPDGGEPEERALAVMRDRQQLRAEAEQLVAECEREDAGRSVDEDYGEPVSVRLAKAFLARN